MRPYITFAYQNVDKSGYKEKEFTPETSCNSDQFVEEIREKFLKSISRNSVPISDRDKIILTKDDQYLKRYLKARNCRASEILHLLRKTMKWRNEFALHVSEDCMFPSEFYKIGAFFPYENDNKGNIVLYFRVRYHLKLTQLVELERRFLAHTFDKIDKVTRDEGLVIVFDYQGASYTNCDIDFFQFLISCTTEHSTTELKYIIVYKLPWVMNAFWSLAKNILPAYLVNKVRFCDESTVTAYIEVDKLPDFMGGTCKRNYRWIPSDCLSLRKLACPHGINDEEVDRILPQLEPLLDEAEKALSKTTYEVPPRHITEYVNSPLTAPILLPKPASNDSSFRINLTCARSQESMIQTGNYCTLPIIRTFPNELIEFKYNPIADIFQASITLYNPSKNKSLTFKIKANNPTLYAVNCARGVLRPQKSTTLRIKSQYPDEQSHKFLLLGSPFQESSSESCLQPDTSSVGSLTGSVTKKMLGLVLRDKASKNNSVSAIKRLEFDQKLSHKRLGHPSFFLFIDLTLIFLFIYRLAVSY